MRALSLMDDKERDAHVAFEHETVLPATRFRAESGQSVRTVKLIKNTLDRNLGALSAIAEREGKEIHDLLIEGDPEIDFRYTGKISSATKTIYVHEDGQIAHNLRFQDILYGPDGEERERKPHESTPANVKTDWPLRWTKRMLPIGDVIKRFVFVRIYQLRHVNGLTFAFLHEMASHLDEAGAMVMIGGGKNGKEPLRFSRGGLPYRAFLRGRVQGDSYLLTMHLTNLELKAVSP